MAGAVATLIAAPTFISLVACREGERSSLSLTLFQQGQQNMKNTVNAGIATTETNKHSVKTTMYGGHRCHS